MSSLCRKKRPTKGAASLCRHLTDVFSSCGVPLCRSASPFATLNTRLLRRRCSFKTITLLSHRCFSAPSAVCAQPNIVVCKGAFVLKPLRTLIPCVDETLLVGWDILLVLDLRLHVLDCVIRKKNYSGPEQNWDTPKTPSVPVLFRPRILLSQNSYDPQFFSLRYKASPGRAICFPSLVQGKKTCRSCTRCVVCICQARRQTAFGEAAEESAEMHARRQEGSVSTCGVWHNRRTGSGRVCCVSSTETVSTQCHTR